MKLSKKYTWSPDIKDVGISDVLIDIASEGHEYFINYVYKTLLPVFNRKLNW